MECNPDLKMLSLIEEFKKLPTPQRAQITSVININNPNTQNSSIEKTKVIDANNIEAALDPDKCIKDKNFNENSSSSLTETVDRRKKIRTYD